MSATQAAIWAGERLLKVKKAREHLFDFMRLMLPDEIVPDDPSLSEYQDTRHGRLLCDVVEKVESGRMHRVAVAIPPQHGKTWHLSTYGLAWILGRNPRARIIVATYNETRAEELGEEFRRVVQSPQFRQIFPKFELETGSQSKTSMSTTKNGRIFFVGVGGTITGRTAHYFFIDDPIKGDEDAQSALYREKLWSWFFSVAYSRGGNKTPIVVIHTRWHHDDLIGRLCDPDHPDREKRYAGVAEDWKFLNIPGVVTDPELAHALRLTLEAPTDQKIVQAFGNKPMSSLWPESKGLEHYAQWKRAEPRTFSALVMGNPSAEDGDYFKAEWIVEYDESDLPPRSELQVYGASDHAVSTKQGRDYTVLGCIGIDKNDDIWILPDLVWDRMETPRTVEEILLNMRKNEPFYWWMESELISKSFGPFLFKRMEEERVYVPVDEVVVSKDKMLRARAIQGRLSMKKVRFPRNAPWFADAKAQLLKFPFGAHDDFVDWLAHIGLGLLKQHTPSTSAHKNGNNIVRVGSISWILQRTKLEEEAKRQGARKAAGW
jgi:predicted phage terminase large subunit-like protein